MYSKKKFYVIKQDGERNSITVTARRMDNDINGNPRYKAHIWSDFSDSIWSPTIKGYKRCKDDGYVLKGYDDLITLMDNLVEAFQVTINEL